MSNLIIKNATIVTSSDIYNADILVSEGKISAIASSLNINNVDDVIDASGLLVMPGGIDVHTHLDMQVGNIITTDDFETGTIAAACGGTTSIIDHPGDGEKGCSPLKPIEDYHKKAHGKAVIDYSFHGVIQYVNNNIFPDIKKMVSDGITSFKLYTTYDYPVHDDDVLNFLSFAKEHGIMTTVHAENDSILKYLRKKYISESKTSPYWHAMSRPDYSESETVNRMLALAKTVGDALLYIVHVSTKKSLDYIDHAIKNGQKNIYAETCIQYIMLNDEYYKLDNADSLKYIISPPLRDKSNNIALWNALNTGGISTIATDHCPFNFHTKKELGLNDFTKCPNGVPGIELRMPLLFSEGVMKNRITLNKFVELTSTNPAKLFGLYPKKGTIAIGSDADFVLFDKNIKKTITLADLHENVDYTPYDGFELIGAPVMTISRGEVIVKNNVFIGKKSRGEFIKRTTTQKITL